MTVNFLSRRLASALVCGLLAAALCPCSAPADTVLSSFDSTADLNSWVRVSPPGTACPLSPDCAVLTGPCATLFDVSAAVKTEGTGSGRLFMQNNSLDGKDCNDQLCAAPFRTLTLANLGVTDWSFGYLRVAVDVRKAAGGESDLSVAMSVEDDAQAWIVASKTLSTADSWEELSVTIQDLADLGFHTDQIKAVGLIFGGSSPPTACTTVYVDNLRLVTGSSPCAPFSVSAVATGVSKQVDLSWSWTQCGTYPIGSYTVYYATYPFTKAYECPTKAAGLGSPAYSATYLTDGSTYYFKVGAADSQGNNSPLGDVGESDTAVPYALCAVSPPTASAAAWSEAIRVTWSAVTGAEEYRIYRQTCSPTCGMSCGTKGSPFEMMPSASTYLDDRTVVDGYQYCYLVTAYDSDTACESLCSPLACDTYTASGGLPCTPPGAVGTLDAALVSPGVRLSWDRPTVGSSPLTSYEIWRGTYSCDMSCKTKIGTVYDTGALRLSFTDTGVAGGAYFCYLVMAESVEAYCTSFSDEACLDVISPPAVLSALACSDRVRVSWSVAAWPGSDYRVYKSTSGGDCTAMVQPGNLLVSMPTASLYYDDYSITTGESYTYVATSWSVTGESLCSPLAWSGTIPGAGLCPCVPPGSMVLSGTAGTTSARLTWNRPVPGDSGLNRYLVCQGTVPSGSLADKSAVATVYEDGSPAYTWTVTGLTKGSNYCFMISAIAVNGCSSTSQEYCLVPSCVSPLPGGAPTAVAVSSTMLFVSWSPASVAPLGDPISGYAVYRSTYPGWPKGLTAKIYDAAATFYNDSGLVLTRQYCYEIAPFDVSSCSAYSAEGCYLCSPPVWSGLEVFNTSVTSSEILLSWDKPDSSGDTPISRYIVYRSDDALCVNLAPAGTVWDDGINSRFSLTNTGLAPAVDYGFEVLAVNASGCSAASPCVSASTQGSCSFLSAPAVSAFSASAVVSWSVTYTGAITGFELWRGGVATGGTPGKTRIAVLPPSALSYTDSGLKADTEYCYVIRMSGGSTCDLYSAEACGRTAKPSAYPNPVSLSKGPVKFDGLAPGAVVEIYTLNGELVRRQTSDSGGLMLWDGKNEAGTTVASGIYIYLVRDSGGTRKGKLVIKK